TSLNYNSKISSKRMNKIIFNQEDSSKDNQTFSPESTYPRIYFETFPITSSQLFNNFRNNSFKIFNISTKYTHQKITKLFPQPNGACKRKSKPFPIPPNNSQL